MTLRKLPTPVSRAAAFDPMDERSDPRHYALRLFATFPWPHDPAKGWPHYPANWHTGKGLSGGWIAVLVVVAILSIASCASAPAVGAGGWAFWVVLYFFARHLERIEEGVAEIQSGRGRYDREYDEYDEPSRAPSASRNQSIPSPRVEAPPTRWEPGPGRTCSHCSERNDSDAEFCATCGQAMAATHCLCGTALRTGAAFCKKCGRRTGPETALVDAAPAAPVPGEVLTSSATAAKRSAPSDPDGWECPCGAWSTIIRTVCRSCGNTRAHAVVIRLRTCRDCGTKNRGDAYRCTKCSNVFHLE